MQIIFQALNLILLLYTELHCLCTILVQSPPLRICRGGGEKTRKKISLKGDGDGRDGNGAKVFSSPFHCWYYNPVAIFSLHLFAHVYHVAFQLVIMFSFLDVTVVFFMYMIFCLYQ